MIQCTEMRWLLWTLLAIPILQCEHAVAGVLSVSGPTNVVWNGGASPVITLSVRNDSPTNDSLLAYQLALVLTPGPGASGVLNFNSVSMPGATYVFDGISIFLPAYPGPPTTVIPPVFVSDFGFDGVTISPTASFDLANIDFDNTDPDAPSGLFLVQLIGFDQDHNTVYFSGVTQEQDFFANVPPGNELVTVASIWIGPPVESDPEPVSVPEPCTAGLLGLGLLLGGASYWGGRRVLILA
ncbi:MAG: hypothetical protein K8T91_28305 [Planctomycetes bacterium]|nr:hypothetical protein [Planctomycetota bacterium]